MLKTLLKPAHLISFQKINVRNHYLLKNYFKPDRGEVTNVLKCKTTHLFDASNLPVTSSRLWSEVFTSAWGCSGRVEYSREQFI